MADIRQTPVQIVVQQPATIKPTFQQQAFGPWTTVAQKTVRATVGTHAQSVLVQRKFQATYPPAPTVVESKTAITGGYEFTINVVNTKNVAGYNIYSSLTNNPNIAKLIQYQPQPPATSTVQALKIQDVTAANPFYWVATVNQAGNESARVPMSGNPAPIPLPTSPLPTGGSSGSGSGGGAVGTRGRIPNNQ